MLKSFQKIICLLLLLAAGAVPAQQGKFKHNEGGSEKENLFYFGIGTSISSFTGGDFGNRFGIRFTGDDDYLPNDDYYENNHYAEYIHGTPIERNSAFLSPLSFTFAAGMNLTQFAAIQVETSLMWHNNGDIANREIVRGYDNGNYLDRNENADLLAIPIMASVKFFPLGKHNSPFYLTGGYGFQLISESIERVRNYYTQGFYNNDYGERRVLERHSQAEFMQGFKAGIGMNYSFFKSLGGEVELSYTNFSTTGGNGDRELTINRVPRIGNISLGTKIFFGL